MNKILIISTLFFFLGLDGLLGQRVAVKTNTLYFATTTPNFELEFSMGNKLTFGIFSGYNPFEFKNDSKEGIEKNPKLRHWIISPELKYWFCKSFERSSLGVHFIYSTYNVGGISFIEPLKDFRYKGFAYGGGISYNYHWAIGGRWGLEFGVGFGYLKLNYKKYNCGSCGDFLGEYKRNYIGPTKISLSLAYFLD